MSGCQQRAGGKLWLVASLCSVGLIVWVLRPFDQLAAEEYVPQSAYLKWQVVDEQKAFGCPPNRGPADVTPDGTWKQRRRRPWPTPPKMTFDRASHLGLYRASYLPGPSNSWFLDIS